MKLGGQSQRSVEKTGFQEGRELTKHLPSMFFLSMSSGGGGVGTGKQDMLSPNVGRVQSTTPSEMASLANGEADAGN